MVRPRKPINWDHVEKMMEAGCPATEISAYYLMSATNFYDRFKDEYGVPFPELAQQYYKKGNASLRSIVYKYALEGNMRMIELICKDRIDLGKEQISIKMEITHVDPTSDSPLEIPMQTLSE